MFLIAIFTFIHDKDEYHLVPLFNSLGFLIVGTASLYYIKKDFHISFQWQSFDTLSYYLKDG